MTNQVIVVRTQIVRTGKQRLEGRPNTRAGEDRRVDFGGRVVGALLGHQLAQQAEREAWGEAYVGGRVFAREDGADINPDAISQLFNSLVKIAGLKRIPLHDLRHGAASLMLGSGDDIALVSKRMGHSTISLTVDTYGHLIGGAGRRSADAAEALVPPGVHAMCTPEPILTRRRHSGSPPKGKPAGQHCGGR